MIEYKNVHFVMISNNTKIELLHMSQMFLHDLSTHKHTKLERVI
jgi:hypothetical protein